jgi:hypothetical protein
MSEQDTSKERFAFRDDPEAIRGIGQRSRSKGVSCFIEMHNSMLSAADEIERLQKRIRELEACSGHEPCPAPSVMDRFSDQEFATILCGHLVSTPDIAERDREFLEQAYRRFKAASAPPPGVIRPNTFAIVDYPEHSLHGERVRVTELYQERRWSIRARESADGKSFTTCALAETELRPCSTATKGGE